MRFVSDDIGLHIPVWCGKRGVPLVELGNKSLSLLASCEFSGFAYPLPPASLDFDDDNLDQAPFGFVLLRCGQVLHRTVPLVGFMSMPTRRRSGTACAGTWGLHSPCSLPADRCTRPARGHVARATGSRHGADFRNR